MQGQIAHLDLNTRLSTGVKFTRRSIHRRRDPFFDPLACVQFSYVPHQIAFTGLIFEIAQDRCSRLIPISEQSFFHQPPHHAENDIFDQTPQTTLPFGFLFKLDLLKEPCDRLEDIPQLFSLMNCNRKDQRSSQVRIGVDAPVLQNNPRIRTGEHQRFNTLHSLGTD